MVKLLRIPSLRTISAMTYCSLLALVFFILALTLPANKASMLHYNLSSLEYHVLFFVVVVPIVASWFAAFYGYSRLRKYACSIAKSAEGNGFSRLADGFAWLAWGLPIGLIVGLLLSAVANNHPGFNRAYIIIINYMNVIVPLIAFSLIGAGSRLLASRAKVNITLTGARSLIFLFAILGVLFCYLTFRHFNLASLTDVGNPYALPIWLVVSSITVPYLYAWLVGLLAAYEIATLGKQAQGLLYRQAMGLFAGGLTAVVASSIALQYVNSVAPHIGYLALNSKLLTTYLIRAIAVTGYLLMATGARRLKKIEEV